MRQTLRHQGQLILLLLGDLLVFALAVVLGLAFLALVYGPDAQGIARPEYGFSALWQRYALSSALVGLIVLAATYTMEFHRSDTRLSGPQIVVRAFMALAGIAVVSVAFVYFFGLSEFGRGHLIATLTAWIGLFIGWRLLHRYVLQDKLPMKRTLVLGAGQAGRTFLEELRKHVHHPYEVVGVADARFGESDAPAELYGAPLLGRDVELKKIVAEHRIDAIIVAITHGIEKKVLSDLIELKFQGVDVEDMGVVYRAISGKVPIRHYNERYFLYNQGFGQAQKPFARTTQRIFDIVFSTLILVLSAPIWLLAMLLLKLEAPRSPLLFIQERVGLFGKPFPMLKFRTLVESAPKDGVWMGGAQEAYVTRLGKFLRKTRINEIPQLINVLRGEMSLIGPRPETPRYVEELSEKIPFYSLRHFVKPGLSGWAAVNAGYASTVEETEQVVQYDLYYIENMGLGLNLLILLKTISTVLFRPGQ